MKQYVDKTRKIRSSYRKPNKKYPQATATSKPKTPSTSRKCNITTLSLCTTLHYYRNIRKMLSRITRVRHD